MRTENEINEYMKEAHDRVWMVRKNEMLEDAFDNNKKIDNEELMRYQEEICYICKEYDIDFYNSVGDWYCGYWSGVSSALNWVLGGDKDFMEV